MKRSGKPRPPPKLVDTKLEHNEGNQAHQDSTGD